MARSELGRYIKEGVGERAGSAGARRGRAPRGELFAAPARAADGAERGGAGEQREQGEHGEQGESTESKQHFNGFS